MKRTSTFLIAFIAALLVFLSGYSDVSASYNMQDFDNTSFPPAGWTVQNTTGYNMTRTTYCSGYGSGLASCVVDFYD